MTSAANSRTPALLRSLSRLLRAAFLTLAFYLLQACVVPYLKVFGVMPNLLAVGVAVLTVSCGKKYAFAAGAAVGILLEAMAASISVFYALVYPSLALLWAQVFADMSDVRREMRRIRAAQRQAQGTVMQKKSLFRRAASLFRRASPEDLEPHLRIALNALALAFSYELIMIVYIALDGVAVSWNHVLRVLMTLVLTLLGSVLMFPSRWFLRMYPARGSRLEIREAASEDEEPQVQHRTVSGRLDTPGQTPPEALEPSPRLPSAQGTGQPEGS